MLSDFIQDCRRIEEWGQEQHKVWQEYIAERKTKGEYLGEHFNFEDLPNVSLDLPSEKRKR